MATSRRIKIFEERLKIKLNRKDLSGTKISLVRGDGMKNGQPRTFMPVGGIEALRCAQAFQKKYAKTLYQGSLIHDNLKYEQFRDFVYNTLKEIKEQMGTDIIMHMSRTKLNGLKERAMW